MPGPLFPSSAIPSGIRTVHASFSGGADSLALLVCLSELRKGAPWELRAVHFEHGIRGEESLADAEFCRKVCERLDIPLLIVPLNVPDRMRPGEGTEAAARRLRQEEWQKIVRRTGDQPGAVVLGHNADDRIESLFLRLMRGSNMSGLHALHAVREFDGIVWLRPLLEISRAEIEAYLAQCGMNDFRTDSTNLENDYDRNRLRNVILPTLYREFPRARAGILTALHAIENDAEALDDAAEEAFRQAARPGGLDLEILAKTPRALLPRILRLWLDGQIPDRHFIGRLRDLLDRPDRHAGTGRIPAEDRGVFLWKNGLLRKAEDDEAVEPEGPVLWDYRKDPVIRFGKTVLRFRGETTPDADAMPSGTDATIFDAKTFPGRLLIAARQSGDAMTPFGSTHSVTLKKLFTDAHVPASDQPRHPVVRDADRPEDVLWVPGVRRASGYPIRTDAQGLLFSAEHLVDVTAAVIGGPDGRILVCSRPTGTHMAGKWEFPGGKIEPGEAPEACIRREIREELGMEISVGPVLTVMEHDYGIKYVRVTFFLAVSDDVPSAKDGQEFRWIVPEDTESVDFLDADRPVSEEIGKNAEKIFGIYNKMRNENVKWLSKQP